MSRLTVLAALPLGAMTIFTMLGCGTETPSAIEFSGNPRPRSAVNMNVVSHAPADVTCIATLTTLDMEHSWFENSDSGHSDGVSPLATFKIAEPMPFTDRPVRILFKYQASEDSAASPNESDIGRKFSFQVPESFLKGESNVIDNSNVRQLRKVEP